MTTKLQVLMVEDAEDDTMFLRRELRQGGYDVVSRRVDTPEDMREALQKEAWDLVISDFVMPRFNGLDALEILKESGLDLPFIIVSGNIGEEIAVGAMKAGAHDYIIKGNLARLVPAVERELREAEVRREKRRADEALKRSYEKLEERVRARTEELAASKVELERLVDELERSNQELEQFAYIASHDLQEPLRMVNSFMRLLEQKYGGQFDDKAKQYIHFARDGAQRMSRLIDDLLMFSRVGRGTREPEPVDMNRIFDIALTNCQASVAECNARVSRDELPTIQGEATLLGQLLQNLVANAVKFRRPEVCPQVQVSASRRDGKWLFVVRDNGIGIAPEQFEKVFQIFKRLHSRAKYEGTGIGLALCQRIVQHHGGRIWVESEPEEGSTFFFELPG